MYWFTADLHLGHTNIIRYCQRPFSKVTEMNYYLTSKWNSVVKPTDTVFHIGDFCFGKISDYINNLQGRIILLRGNHDKESPILDIRIRIKDKEFLLTHRPEETSPGYPLCLVGHVHDKWKFKTMTFEKYKWDVCNVGVDVWNFEPTNIDNILSEYEKWKKLVRR